MLSLNCVGSALPWLLAGCQVPRDSIELKQITARKQEQQRVKLYHLRFHVGILLIKPLQPHLSAATGHYALCRPPPPPPPNCARVCACMRRRAFVQSCRRHRNVKSPHYLSGKCVIADQSCVDMSTLLCTIRMHWNSALRRKVRVSVGCGPSVFSRRERWARRVRR